MLLYFTLRHSRSTNTLSIQRALPSMLMRTPVVGQHRGKVFVGELAALVGVENLGGAVAMQRLSQGLDAEIGARVLQTRKASTLRL